MSSKKVSEFTSHACILPLVRVTTGMIHVRLGRNAINVCILKLDNYQFPTTDH